MQRKETPEGRKEIEGKELLKNEKINRKRKETG